MAERNPEKNEKKMITHCQEVHTYLTEIGEKAQKELEKIERSKNMKYKEILDAFFRTRDILNKVTSKLMEYSKFSVEICDSEETEQKKSQY